MLLTHVEEALRPQTQPRIDDIALHTCGPQQAVLPREASSLTDDFTPAHVPFQCFQNILQRFTGTLYNDTSIRVLPASRNLLQHLFRQTLLAPSRTALPPDERGQLLQSGGVEG
ncbi:unnamed protein product [Clonostachys byssicola]|uniref:Uncharacterized protein n=1 Tax=Clonostachys byssicola TaxID=160290 RepID=A0A9N9V0N0_9HYPO|nr:unnamed protein product [Clonostachys byssicola]